MVDGALPGYTLLLHGRDTWLRLESTEVVRSSLLLVVSICNLLADPDVVVSRSKDMMPGALLPIGLTVLGLAFGLDGSKVFELLLVKDRVRGRVLELFQGGLVRLRVGIRLAAIFEDREVGGLVADDLLYPALTDSVFVVAAAQVGSLLRILEQLVELPP